MEKEREGFLLDFNFGADDDTSSKTGEKGSNGKK